MATPPEEEMLPFPVTAADILLHQHAQLEGETGEAARVALAMEKQEAAEADAAAEAEAAASLPSFPASPLEVRAPFD